MINQRKHTEKLFIYCVLHGVVCGCYKENPILNEGELIKTITDIKNAELDRKKSQKTMARALNLTKTIFDNDTTGENGLKILLAVKYLFQNLIDDGFEIFDAEEYGYELFIELLNYVDPDAQIDFDKKDRKAQKLAIKWREELNKQGYFL